MHPAALTTVGEGRYALSGDLVFESAPRLLDEGDAAFGSGKSVEVDLAAVRRVDSAGLALLLEWSICAREAGYTLRYRNMPDPLASLAAISGVSELLGSADAAGG